MDPATQAQFQQIQEQLALLHQQNLHLQQQQQQQQQHALEQALEQQQSLLVAPSSRPDPKVKLPEGYDGNPKTLRPFLNQIQLVLAQQPKSYPSGDDACRVRLVANLLIGPALAWWSHLFETHHPSLDDFNAFTNLMRARFDDPNRQSAAAIELSALRLKKGQTVSSMSSTFRMLVLDAGWDDTSSQYAFRRTLSDSHRDLLMTFTEPANLDELISQAITIDNRLLQRLRDSGGFPTQTTAEIPAQAPAMMDIDAVIQQLQAVLTKNSRRNNPRIRLDPLERQRRLDNNLCLYAGCEGHIAVDCPLRPQGNASGRR
jgi:hypothetical protein